MAKINTYHRYVVRTKALLLIRRLLLAGPYCVYLVCGKKHGLCGKKHRCRPLVNAVVMEERTVESKKPNGNVQAVKLSNARATMNGEQPSGRESTREGRVEVFSRQKIAQGHELKVGRDRAKKRKGSKWGGEKQTQRKT